MSLHGSIGTPVRIVAAVLALGWVGGLGAVKVDAQDKGAGPY